MHQKNADITILEVEGDLDLYNTHLLKKAFTEIIANNTKKLILHVSDLTYIDSCGVGTLIYIYSTALKEGVKMIISGLHGQPYKVIELTKLTSFFPFAKSIDEARKKLE